MGQQATASGGVHFDKVAGMLETPAHSAVSEIASLAFAAESTVLQAARRLDLAAVALYAVGDDTLTDREDDALLVEAAIANASAKHREFERGIARAPKSSSRGRLMQASDRQLVQCCIGMELGVSEIERPLVQQHRREFVKSHAITLPIVSAFGCQRDAQNGLCVLDGNGSNISTRWLTGSHG
jgi:hypothetical protein